jgi:hypothetical protein
MPLLWEALAMPDHKDVLAYLVPKSPLSLSREGKFPDYMEVLAQMAWAEQVARLLGYRYCWLCRLTGAAWIIWVINFFGALSILGVMGFSWAKDMPLTPNVKITLAAVGAVLFLGAMLYSGTVLLALQIADSCIKEIKIRKTSELTVPEEFRRKTGVSE